MAHDLRRLASAGREVSRLARAQLHRGQAALQARGTPLDARVHAARTAIKKTRALVRLVRTGLARPRARRQARRANRHLAKLACRMAPLRDAAVAITTFDRLTTGMSPDWQPFLRGFRARLSAILARRTRRFERHQTLRRLRAGFERASVRVKRWRPEGELRRATTRGFEAGYARARRAMARAIDRDDGDAFHAWRRASKDHRHQVQFLTELGSVAERRSARSSAAAGPLPRTDDPAAGRPALRARLAILEQLDERLGREHDLTCLEAVIERQRRHFHEPKARLHVLRALEHRRRALREEARALGLQLYAHGPRTFFRTLGAVETGTGAPTEPEARGGAAEASPDRVGRVGRDDSTSAGARATARSRSVSAAV